MRTPPHIVILGGGFGGLFTARHAAGRLGGRARVTLVDAGERFVFKPLLYDLLADEVDERDIAPRFDDVLPRAVRRLRARARHVDLVDRAVLLEGDAPARLPFDILVLALGSEPDDLGMPGAAVHARPAACLEDFRALRAHLADRLARPEARGGDARARQLRRAVVIGGGPGGVEVALKLADRLGPTGEVEVVEALPEVLVGFSEGMRRVASARLAARGIRLRLRTRVERVHDGGLTVRGDGAPEAERLFAGTVVLAAGARPVRLPSTPDLARDDAGRLLVSATLEVAGPAPVLALGDMARIAGAADAPATAQIAVQQAAAAVRTLEARLDGREPPPFRPLPLAETLALGASEDAFRAFGVTLTGRAGRLVRRSAYLVRMPGLAHRLRAGARWALEAARVTAR